MNEKKKISASKARFINPPNRIKQKAGSGGISDTLIERAQFHIETSDFDYTPEAEIHIKALSDIIAGLKKGKTTGPVDPLINPVMQLKASGGMFHYQLVSDVADIALNFLESLKTLNDAALDVVQAHLHTIRIIMNNKLKGDGGKEGFALIQELDKACQRYYAKYDPEGNKKAK
ncbi:MAG: hypothetical protein LRZ85_07965 [Alphaproteobacteria bacterium]|nr:hypothetical protein [Alphaproteobacteria bacterium]MCD8525712.1 hypothetical protein [Alphaproteobacteria bacterium]MCD8570701.1 hypothetical protein [Alphaproteobacteria bacterium]